jgi:hypothetical protein
MNIQEVFNKVIEAGIYDPSNKAIDSCKDFMCNALEEARLCGIISGIEVLCSSGEIEDFIHKNSGCKFNTMYIVLKDAGVVNYDDSNVSSLLLSIYKNWDKRYKILAGEC